MENTKVKSAVIDYMIYKDQPGNDITVKNPNDRKYLISHFLIDLRFVQLKPLIEHLTKPLREKNLYAIKKKYDFVNFEYSGFTQFEFVLLLQAINDMYSDDIDN